MTAKQRERAEKRVAELDLIIAHAQRKIESRAYGGGALAEIRADLKRATERRANWLEKLAANG